MSVYMTSLISVISIYGILTNLMVIFVNLSVMPHTNTNRTLKTLLAQIVDNLCNTNQMCGYDQLDFFRIDL